MNFSRRFYWALVLAPVKRNILIFLPADLGMSRVGLKKVGLPKCHPSAVEFIVIRNRSFHSIHLGLFLPYSPSSVSAVITQVYQAWESIARKNNAFYQIDTWSAKAILLMAWIMQTVAKMILRLSRWHTVFMLSLSSPRCNGIWCIFWRFFLSVHSRIGCQILCSKENLERWQRDVTLHSLRATVIEGEWIVSTVTLDSKFLCVILPNLLSRQLVSSCGSWIFSTF